MRYVYRPYQVPNLLGWRPKIAANWSYIWEDHHDHDFVVFNSTQKKEVEGSKKFTKKFLNGPNLDAQKKLPAFCGAKCMITCKNVSAIFP